MEHYGITTLCGFTVMRLQGDEGAVSSSVQE